MIALALTNHGAWGIALIIGVVAALALAALLLLLIRTTGDILRSAARLLDVAGNVAGNTSNIPQLQATAPVLGKIVDEAVVHHKAGRFSEAERLYRQVLAVNPKHPDALHLLGIKTEMPLDARAFGQRVHVAPDRVRGFPVARAQGPIGRAALVRTV